MNAREWMRQKITRDRLRLEFRVLSDKRQYFPGVEWLQFELLGMLAACNEQIANAEGRGGLRTNMMTLAEVQQCESLASGHVDYYEKFPLYLTERMYNL